MAGIRLPIIVRDIAIGKVMLILSMSFELPDLVTIH